MHWTGEPYTVELFDDRGNLIEVLSNHGTLDEAREAYAARLKKPRRANRVIYLCLKAQILRRSDRMD
jgi:hypothetical protein